MAIDWERVVVESDDNGVVVSAGQVSLLIGADADSVSWGNITGDITQQPDLMQIVDGYVSADSPTFTGIPRSVTPPEGNNSTRIATTAFVQGEMANVRRDVSDKVNEAPINNHIWGRKDENWAQLGEMATVDEPARGISSSVPQRFVRTKEPDGDMVWEKVGTMVMIDAPDSLTPNITYGLYNGEMVNIDPTPNSSAIKKYWLRTNDVIKEGEHTGDRDPKWERAGTMALGDDPLNYSTQIKKYVRTSRYDIDKEKIVNEWALLDVGDWGDMAYVDDVPTLDYYYRQKGGWVRVPIPKNFVFVDGDRGNDDNDGSALNPYKTIGKAIEVLSSGGIIGIAATEYQEVVEIKYNRFYIYPYKYPTTYPSYSDAPEITISKLIVKDNGALDIRGNYIINGQLNLLDGGRMTHKQGKLTINYPVGVEDYTPDRIHAIGVSDSALSLTDVEITWNPDAATGVAVYGASHVYIGNIKAILSQNSSNLFSVEGGLIQWGTLDASSQYVTKYLNNSTHTYDGISET